MLGRNRKKSSIWLLEIAFLVLARHYYRRLWVFFDTIIIIWARSAGFTSAATDAPYRDSSLYKLSAIDDLSPGMTLDEKIGQMALVEKKQH